MKDKYLGLIRDLFLFTISTFVPKAISFFLVPLYTNCLSTTEYGIADMIATTVSLIIPFLTLNISDAVLRFTIEKKENKKPLQIAYKMVLCGIALLISIVAINIILKIYHINVEYQIFFLLQYIVTVTYGINISYLRATDRVGLLSTVSIVNTVVTVLLNLFTLLVLKMGLTGYLLSSIAGLLLANVVIVRKIYLFKLMKGNHEKDKGLCKQMVEYSAPLAASNVAWWVNSASDRYFVTFFCGIEENGIYSIAYKIPTILQLLQSVFSQAWLLAIYREYNKTEGKAFVSKVYDLYNSAMCISCALLILMDIPMARFFYAKEFFVAWKYVPPLLISIVFIANAGFFESLLTLFKKSKVVAATTILGATVNIAFNIALIPSMGAVGAAIATACGYLTMWVLRIGAIKKYYPFHINWLKHGSLIVLLTIESYVMCNTQSYLWCTFIITMMLIINCKTLIIIVKLGAAKIKRFLNRQIG